MSAESDGVLATGWRTNAVGSRDVQTVQRDGREYLVFPLVPIAEMVLSYPERGTKEYLPAKHIRDSAPLWDGTLLTHVHPENRNRTVRDPDEFMGSVIGAFHDPEVLDGGEKLRGNGLIDVEKATALGGSAAELVELLRRGEEVSVSAGYTTTDDEQRPGRFDGEQYDLVQGAPLLPDHIAIFPSDSRVQARCSPQDGCAAPRANASQNGQPVNQRANEREETQMSETEIVDTPEEQKQMTTELSSLLDDVDESGVASDRQAAELRRMQNVVDSLGQTLERGETDVSPALGAVVRSGKALVADVLNETETTEPTDEKTNAGANECGCAGICRCDPSTSGSDGTGESLPNMRAVPGRVNRDLDAGRDSHREDSDEYPAGGRKCWERRQVGLSDVEADDEYPAGGRSAWQARKQKGRQNAEESAAGTPTSAAARRSLTARENYVAAKEWVTAEYPLLARRQAQEREERRQRHEELKERSKRNYARHMEQNSSDESQ